jgi:hypothetical protein
MLLALTLRKRAHPVDVTGDQEENIEIRASHSRHVNVSGTRIVVSSGFFESTADQTMKNLKAALLRTPNATDRGDQ